MIYVEWWDSCKKADWELLIEATHDFKTPTKNIGYLISETETGISIAMAYDEETSSVANVMHIPKCSIKKRKYL